MNRTIYAIVSSPVLRNESSESSDRDKGNDRDKGYDPDNRNDRNDHIKSYDRDDRDDRDKSKIAIAGTSRTITKAIATTAYRNDRDKSYDCDDRDDRDDRRPTTVLRATIATIGRTGNEGTKGTKGTKGTIVITAIYSGIYDRENYITQVERTVCHSM